MLNNEDFGGEMEKTQIMPNKSNSCLSTETTNERILGKGNVQWAGRVGRLYF